MYTHTHLRIHLRIEICNIYKYIYLFNMYMCTHTHVKYRWDKWLVVRIPVLACSLAPSGSNPQAWKAAAQLTKSLGLQKAPDRRQNLCMLSQYTEFPPWALLSTSLILRVKCCSTFQTSNRDSECPSHDGAVASIRSHGKIIRNVPGTPVTNIEILQIPI